MLRSLTSFAKALPFCCGLLFIAAAEDGCVIFDFGDPPEVCEDTESVCNLECELAVNGEGCPICECAEQPLPDECASDSDCANAQVCTFTETCPPCNTAICDDPCTSEGRCVDIVPLSCAAVLCAPDTICVEDNGQAQCIPVDTNYCGTDDECVDGHFCDFSQCGGTSDPPQGGSDEGGDGESGDVICAGVCREIPPLSCAAVLCEQGTTCIEDPHGPVCIPNVSECSQDEDCGPSAHCENYCTSDPNCPSCDICMVIGQCVANNDCEALCGVGSECLVDVDGMLTCQPVPVAECTSDSECDGGICNAADLCLSDPACGGSNDGLVACTAVCWGFCVEPLPAACVVNEDCAAGEVCQTDSDCVECAPSAPDGPDLPCAPCPVEGQCVAAP